MNFDWMRRYQGIYGGSDGANSIVVDDSENICVTGGSEISSGYEYITIKYNKFGDSLWVRTYRRPEPNYTIASDLAVDDSGNVFVTGLPTIKYDGNGNIIWISEYSQVNKKIILDSLGNIIVGGIAFDQIVVAKYDRNGNRIWRKVNGIMEQQHFRDITVDKFGNVIVTGDARSSTTYYDFVTIKYTGNGDLSWIKKYNGISPFPNPYDGAYAVETDDNGNVYVTGVSQGLTGGDNCVTIKYDSSGNEIWIKRITSASGGFDIGIDKSKNIYIAGRYGGSSYTFKLDSSSNELWGNFYFSNDGFATNYPKLILDSINNLYVTTNSTASGNTDYAFIKYDSLGNEIYSIIYIYSVLGDDYVNDMALDKKGNVYLTGQVQSGGGYAYATVKYSPIMTNLVNNIDPVKGFNLLQNYPNPFNPKTVINYVIPSNLKRERSNVELIVYNTLGKEVTTLVNQKQNAGSYSVSFDARDGQGSNLSSGIYFYSLLIDGNVVDTKQMVLLK